MAAPFVLAIKREFTLAEESEEVLTLACPFGRVKLNRPSEGLAAAVHRLIDGGATEDELAALVYEIDGPETLARLYYYLGEFKRRMMLTFAVATDAGPLATLIPASFSFAFSPEPPAETAVVLSRFAYCRRLEDTFVVESPLGHARVVLGGPAGALLLAALARPQTRAELCAAVPGLTEESVAMVLTLLANAGALTLEGEEGAAEDANSTLRQWDFHDLLFHSRSRLGRHDYRFGGNFRFVGTIPPQPAVKPKMDGERIDLYRPDLSAVVAGDRPFTEVLESRTSVRSYAETPITLAQIGEFLYRTARVRTKFGPDEAIHLPYEASSRPYPNGGASYEFELYLSVNQCDGLAPGLYHYEPEDHQLTRLSGRTPEVERMLYDACLSTVRIVVPQVLITFGARFQRVSWKYDAMAYAAILKNVGALYQTMYLVATAMDLAPCALGSGNADTFAKAAGTDYLQESSVGEFLLGSKPAASG